MSNAIGRWATMAFLTASALGANAVAQPAPQPAPQAAGGIAPFLGNYSLNSTTTVTVSTPISQTESRSTHERLAVQPGTTSELDFIVTNDLGDRCVLRANRSGVGAVSFPAGQPCAMTDGERNLRLALTLRSGTGTLQGDVLLMDFSWEVSVDAGFMTVHGLAAQRSSGRRDGGPAIVAPTPVAVAPVGGPGIYAPGVVQGTQGTVPAAQPGLTGSPWITTGPSGGFGTPMPSQPTQPAAWGTPAPMPAQPQSPTAQPVWGAPQPAAWGTPAPMPTQPTVWGAPAPTPAWNTSAPTINTPASAWGAPGGAPSSNMPSITFGSLSQPTVLPSSARHPTRPARPSRVTRVAPIDVPRR